MSDASESRVLVDPRPDQPLRLLVATNAFPHGANPAYGMFVREQVDALRRHPGVERVDVLFVNGSVAKANYLRGILLLHRQLRRRAYDLVHAHYGLTVGLAVAQGRTPVVATFHGGDVSVKPWQRRVSQLAARRTVGNIIVSESHQELLGSPATYIPCGIDVGQFGPRDREAARREFGVPEGHAALLFPSEPTRPKKLYPRFQEVVAELERRGRAVHELHLVDIPRDRVPHLMSAADVLVMTSFGEGAPVALMEAMASGLPIVATPSGQVAKMLDGVPKAHCLEWDLEAFADRVEGLLGASDGQRVPADRSREFDEDEIADRLVQLYRAALGR